MKIDELAKKTIEEIIKLYKQNKITKKEIENILKNYSDEVKKEIEDKLQDELGDFYFNNTNPQIAVTPVKLSEMLYLNAKNVAKEVNHILNKSIKAKETIGAISKKLYEGYGFRDKEVLDALKVLPKYLQEAVKKNNKNIMKDIEKLKTKPLRIAYKNIIKKMDKLSNEALQNHLRTAYHEKIRYYAKRIADTETHRAMMSKRASEYLNDDDVEFVKFMMSSRHPKTDICDFYANLDMGYGAGIIPKREMRSTPFHPHCHCFYAPYYRQVKGKKKSFKSAVNDTMNKFSEREQREILATSAMLERFKAGEDIEEIFNTIRPKYPIRKYIDIIPKKFEDVSVDIKTMLDEIKAKNRLTKNKIVVGILDKKIIEFLEKKDIPIYTKKIYLNSKGLSHLARESKKQRGAGLSEKDILRIPEVLKSPSGVFFDNNKNKLNLLYCKNDSCEKMIKLVIDTKTIYKGEKLTLIKTAGYIKWHNIRNKEYEQIK